MSVQVTNLRKVYDTQLAVNDISFEAHKGEILGFLGPNGAGKTTTMKILTCYIPQTSGSATVCGFDTAANPMEVRKQIGYLPEHNPLYKDMYVKEYLGFVAKLHKLPNATKRIAEMIDMTGLGLEQNKKIGALSKGFRQRVGLAQAMIHDPKVLILDEPTSGLDPNQLMDIRTLIKEIGKEKTVIFSTHIMQEVEALCNRVVIINRGNIVANDSIQDLQERTKGASKVTVEFGVPFKDFKKLQNIKGVAKVESLNPNMTKFSLTVESGQDVRPELFKFATDNNIPLLELHQEQVSIETIFQVLTKGKA